MTEVYVRHYVTYNDPIQECSFGAMYRRISYLG